MWLKSGVSIVRLNRDIRRSLPVVDKWCDKGGGNLLITSADDGNHGAGSLHYCNDAYDFVCLGGGQQMVADGVRHELGPNYDVIVERSHTHIEYDPKKGG